MVNTNRNIIRGVLILSYIIIISIIVFLISSLYSYFNTGADRSKMLHTELKKENIYTPEFSWKNNGNEGRTISDQVLNEVENDYLDAWYIKQIAYRENQKIGVDDYYTKNARKNIYNIIDQNKIDNSHIESTTLAHNPDILFYSEDGQLIVLEDKDVVQHQKIYKENKHLISITESSDYKHILLLEDGFWRIRHTVKEKTADYDTSVKNIRTDTLNIKGINYYPKDTPWNMFGDSFNIQTISSDFDLIKRANLNSIRIFVPYEDFGKAEVKQEKLDKLKLVLDQADTQNLKVVVTLFDFYGNYNVLDWTLTYKHAKEIVSAFKDHEAILAWDLKNEPNLDFDSRGKQNVVSWLEYLIILVKSIDDNHPITIGWSNVESATILSEKVDYVSFHYYEDLQNFETSYLALKNKINSKPIILQEYGLSSYGGFWRPFGSSEQKQADYHQEIQKVLTKNKINFMSWTLYDFKDVPKSVVGTLPWRTNPQKKFGFITANGKKKPAFQFISNKN